MRNRWSYPADLGSLEGGRYSPHLQISVYWRSDKFALTRNDTLYRTTLYLRERLCVNSIHSFFTLPVGTSRTLTCCILMHVSISVCL